MPTYTFLGCPASVTATFDCPSCGKAKRKRTFRHECTVNPFNVKEDGTPRTSTEVFRQSADYADKDRDEFLREPLCKTCEDAISYTERKALRERRKSPAPRHPPRTEE